MSTRERSRPSTGGITFHHPGAFWLGIVAVTVGVALHLPMFLAGEDTCKLVPGATPGSPKVQQCYVLADQMVDTPMKIGMILTLVGIALTAYALFPRLSQVSQGAVSRVRVKALDDAPIKKTHVALLLVMAAAITIDVMKPTTLGFVVPGMAKEYGLKSALNPTATVPIAWLPFAGITGTVIGSFLWGWLGDRMGRRASILLAGVLFIATSICGSMPNYTWNFITCFIMGLGVGGMLPITFALMAETIPARHRGWLMVLIGGDVIGAYIITSWLASTVGSPANFGWRILWLLGFPTGLLLIVLNRWIPESPRFLLANGRDEEARAVMERYGAAVVEEAHSDLEVEEQVKSRFAQLFAKPFGGLSLAVGIFGLGVGLVSFGFQLWIPTNLQKLGFTEVTSDRILRDSAIIGFPATFLIAWLYGFWSSKKTMIVLALLTAAALLGFVVVGDEVATNRVLLYALLAMPITGISSILAVLIAYSSEVYPTRIRARGTGLAAGASKAGGVLVIALVLFAISIPSIRATALLGAIPLIVAALAIAVYGIETRKKTLEQITAEEIREAAPVG
jgi:putative MFS transporter